MLKAIVDQFERGDVVQDCVEVLEEEVASKKGISGLAVKGAFKVIGAVRPGFLQAVINGLLDEFVGELEPFYAEWVDAGEPGEFSEYLVANGPRVAEGLLGVTDKRAQTTDHQTVKKAYLKMRPSGVEHTIAALPRVGAMMDRYLAA